MSQAMLNIQTKIIICGLASFWLKELHLTIDSFFFFFNGVIICRILKPSWKFPLKPFGH